MKKKLLGLLIVLCLIVVMIPILTSADSEPDTVKFLIPSGVEVQRGSTVYLVCTETGSTTKTGATEDNYNIKIVYNNGETPVIYLRGAYISGAYGSIRTNDTGVQSSQIASKTTIVVEKELGNATSYVPEGITADSYLSHNINMKEADLEIQGPGKLKVDNMINVGGYYLTFNNADVEATSAASTVTIGAKKVTFNGGKAVFEQSGSVPAFRAWGSSTNEGVVVNGADVTMRKTDTSAADQPLQIVNSPLSKVIVNSGRLYLESNSNAAALRCTTENGFVINGGTVEMSSKYSVAIDGTTAGIIPVLSNYKNAVNENNYLAYNNKNGNLYPAGAGLINYTYFKVVPAYNVTAEGATASATKVAEGATVTLTPTIPTGKTLIGWTSSDVTVAEDNTFVMPAKNVSVTANFAFRSTIKLAGTDYTFTDEAPVYLKTGEDGAITGEGTATDYNVMLAFDANKVPTVYLKNANLSYEDSVIESGNGTTLFAIETQAPSTLFQTGKAPSSEETRYDGAVEATGKVIFRGSALLTMKGNATGICGNNSLEVLFEGANVDLSRTGAYCGWYEGAFTGSFSSITFNGGTAMIKAPRRFIQTAAPINIKGGAVVSMINENAGHINASSNTITVEDGSLYIESNGGVSMLANSVVKVLENGVFEAYNKHASGSVSTKAANLADFNGYYAIMGSSRATATEYVAVEGELPALTGQYFKVGKAKTVNVTDGDNQYSVKAFIGETVTLTPGTAPAGQVFAGWTVTSNNATVNGSSFVMPAENVSVNANYGVAGSITIGSTEYTAIKGGAAIYFKTDANGNVSVGGDENNYNLKFVYADAEGAVPTLYMKDAYVNTTIKSNAFSAGTTKIVIVDADGTVTTASGDVAADTYITNTITWTHGALVIEGPGKLKMVTSGACIAAAGQQLTFKGVEADLEVTTGSASGGSSCFSGHIIKIVFDGAKVNARSKYATHLVYQGDDTAILGYEILNGSDITLSSEFSSAIYNDADSAKVLVDGNSKLKLHTDGEGKEAIRLDSYNLIVNSGVLEISAPNGKAGYSRLMPTLDNYKNSVNENTYYAIVSKAADFSTWENLGESTLQNYKHLRVEPAFKITVNGEAAASSPAAPVGAVVTLTPKPVAGKKLGSWTVDDGSTAVTIEDNKFIMPAGNVSITANFVVDPNADGGPEMVVFSFAGTKVNVNRGETYYLITNANGVATQDGANEDNYNIKIEYERIKDKTPVIYLRGAYLKGSYGAIINNDYGSLCTDNERASKVTIVVEKELGNAVSAVPADVTADSYLVSYIFLTKGGLEIQGPGKLVVNQTTVMENGAEKVISGKIHVGGDLTFKNADVKVLNGALKGQNITFDGGKVDVTSTGEVVISIWKSPYTVLVTNDAQVSLTSTDKAAMHIVGESTESIATLQIDSGSLVLKSTAEGNDSEKAALKMSAGSSKFIMNGGTLELSGTVTVVTGNIEMTLNGTFDAICANNADGNNPVAYKDTTIKQYNSSWQLKYFKIQPGTGSSDDNTGSGSSTGTHTHSTTKVKGKAASCTADGVKEHYKCSCGKFFEDKAAKKEITNIDTWKVIKATGHKDANKDGICDTCKKSAQTSDNSFTALWITLLAVSAMGACVTFVYNKKRATK